jgi:hypothetical protein
MRFRVGAKQRRAILDDDNYKEVLIINPKYKHLTQDICDFLNREFLASEQPRVEEHEQTKEICTCNSLNEGVTSGVHNGCGKRLRLLQIASLSKYAIRFNQKSKAQIKEELDLDSIHKKKEDELEIFLEKYKKAGQQ